MILIYNYVLSSKIFGECFTCSTFIECLLGVRKVFSVFQLISLKQTKLDVPSCIFQPYNKLLVRLLTVA